MARPGRGSALPARRDREERDGQRPSGIGRGPALRKRGTASAFMACRVNCRALAGGDGIRVAGPCWALPARRHPADNVMRGLHPPMDDRLPELGQLRKPSFAAGPLRLRPSAVIARTGIARLGPLGMASATRITRDTRSIVGGAAPGQRHSGGQLPAREGPQAPGSRRPLPVPSWKRG